LLDLGPHEVLRLKGEEGEILIPFVAQYVDQVDTEAKVITVDWGKDY
jgi:16S rRNA processing protein RimM